MDNTDLWKEFCESRGYKPENNYWETISDAELYGGKTLKKAYAKCLKDAGTDKIKLTELSLVLLKKYEYADNEDDDIYMQLFYDLYSEVDSFACDNLDEVEIIYYMRTVK